jgi:NAD(P)H-flavin reductase
LLDFPVFSQSLCFGIKPYKGPKALSAELCSAKKGQKFSVEGPFGTGLDISRKFRGHCVLIGFGTGILPYLDLFDFLLKKAIYLKLIQLKRTDRLGDIQPEQDYAQIFPGAKFTYFGAFKEPADFIGQHFISKLYSISRENNLELFDCLVRIKNAELKVPTTTGYIDKEFIRQRIVNNPVEVKKLVICATNEAMKNISRWCQELGFPKGRIHFV